MTIATDMRARRGARSHHAGLAAEARVAEAYARRGFTLAHRRWRGRGGEIDLILRRGAQVVFVEVKQARDARRAAEALQPRQIARLFTAAEEFLAGEPAGALTDTRFDVALMDGAGGIEIVENALGAA